VPLPGERFDGDRRHGDALELILLRQNGCPGVCLKTAQAVGVNV
jgi:hypothetical protein